MTEPQVLEGTAAELRRAFDASFARAPAEASQEFEDLLAIRVAGDPYAIRLRDIAGVVARRKVVSVPAATLDLVGLAGIRGGIVPVFALASILGYAKEQESPRWMVLCGVEEPIALGFSDFEGYLRLAKGSFHADEDLRATRQYLQVVASTDAGVRAVIGVPLVVATIRNRTGPHRPPKEQ